MWNILKSVFVSLKVDNLSNESKIEQGLGIDIFLRPKASEFVLYMSITETRFYINSKYFDIYVYPETEIDKIEHLLKQILLGQYSINLGYNKNGKLKKKGIVFSDEKLREFNEDQKIGFLKKKVENEKRIEGVKFIRS